MLSDADLTSLHQGADIDPDFAAQRLGRQQVFEAIGDKDVSLRYGHNYQFRVRLADLAGRPAGRGRNTRRPAAEAHHLVEVAFRRHRKPGMVEVLERPRPSQADPPCELAASASRSPVHGQV